VDAWIFARQMDQLFSDGASAAAFGSFQPEAVEVAHRLVGRMREIGGSIAVSPQTRAEFERKFIAPWVAEHPLRDMTFVRESPIARFAEQSRASGDTLQSVATLEELAITLSQQARIYLADLPRQVRAEVDLMRSDIMPPEGLAAMQNDLHVTAAAADRLAATLEAVPPRVTDERRIVLDELNRQRGLVMDAVSVERERGVGALLQSLSAERRQLVQDVNLQRLATLEWATAERRDAIAQIRDELSRSVDALRVERGIVVDDLRRIVDMVLLRLALFIVIAVVLAPLVAHGYARVWPRR
jgi:hypothetical protein